ncbi:hypothetical protein trd_0656 [Thermomicrobium roseum DSM 5159]|uniref:Uncharacterized protein n=1 Tax=Thermomicrobium roseum (strain ATCC 27502 / DSM 5159 / P-2) TaxID=309801 RepID=B9KYV2_THERP|nr:hypothetical protein trd_0656 [Thermomicrobium roseum DSM 5159]
MNDTPSIATNSRRTPIVDRGQAAIDVEASPRFPSTLVLWIACSR